MALMKNKGSDRDVACRKSHSKLEMRPGMRPDLCFHISPGFCEPLMVQERPVLSLSEGPASFSVIPGRQKVWRCRLP